MDVTAFIVRLDVRVLLRCPKLVRKPEGFNQSGCRYFALILNDDLNQFEETVETLPSCSATIAQRRVKMGENQLSDFVASAERNDDGLSDLRQIFNALNFIRVLLIKSANFSYQWLRSIRRWWVLTWKRTCLISDSIAATRHATMSARLGFAAAS